MEFDMQGGSTNESGTTLPGFAFGGAGDGGGGTPVVEPADILCNQMITGSNTGTRAAITGSANNCLDA